MKKLLLLSLLGLALFSCEKEDGASPSAQLSECERLETGMWCFENAISDGINIYVDNDFQFKLSSGQERCVTLSSGVHSYEGIQSDGFILFPDEWSGSEDLIICQTKKTRLIR